MVKSTKPEREERFRRIHGFLQENPRMTYRSISERLKVNEKTASGMVHLMIEQGIITNPQARIRSYRNVREYVSFVQVKNKFKAYQRAMKDESVLYAGVLMGSPNFWVVSRHPGEVGGDVYVEGVRSDFYVAEPSRKTWNESIAAMKDVVEHFPAERGESPLAFHGDEELRWDEEDDTLYWEFKYNVRREYKKLMKKYCISCRKIKTWLKRSNETCTVFTRFFPDGITFYDPHLFFIKTRYEKSVVDLFGMLPTSTLYFKVGDVLVVEPYLRTDYFRESFSRKAQIPLMLEALSDRGYITDYNYVLEDYSYWRTV